MAWVNRSDEIYVEEMGRDVFEERKRTQFQAPSQWFPTASLVLTANALRLLFSAMTFARKSRVPHPVGAGLKGYAEVVKDSRLPEDSYFTPGRKFAVNARFSSAHDKGTDLYKDGKSIAFELHDLSDGDATAVQFVFLTGETTIITDLDTMVNIMKKGASGDGFREFAFSRPQSLNAVINSFRRCPESFSDQRFFAQMTFEYQTSTQGRKLARFRVVPTDGRPETGRLSEEEQRSIGSREPLPSETRAPNYLKDEILERVKNEEVKFTFQIQLHDLDKTTTDEAYNAGIAWSDVTSPWLDLMVLTLNSSLTEDETRRLKFNVQNLPPCLGFKEAFSKYSPASVPYARGKVYGACQTIRGWRDY